MDEIHFDGDPAMDSTRRRLERVMQGEQRPRWPWLAALAAGGTAFALWQVRRRRRRRNESGKESGNGNTNAE